MRKRKLLIVKLSLVRNPQRFGHLFVEHSVSLFLPFNVEYLSGYKTLLKWRDDLYPSYGLRSRRDRALGGFEW